MPDWQPSPEFIPISPNPYIVGNPVRDRSMFFGREAEFEFVRSRIQDAVAQGHGGLLLVFCGERRSGKTSILFQILDHRLGPDYVPVLIDMQSMAVGNEVEFLSRVSEEILVALGETGRSIAPPDFTSDSRHAATFRKFVQDVLKACPRKQIILLFDEYELFENKIDSGHLSNDVLLILASMMEHDRVFLVFTGSQHIDRRRRDYWEKFLPKSHFKTISYLERQDAMNLVTKPVEGRVRYADHAVERIYRLTAGQPFYTQAICQNLVDVLNEHRTSLATAEALTEVVDALVNNPLPQMIFLWDALGRDEKLVLALLAECLESETAFAGYDEIRRLHKRRGYHLGLDEGRIAPSLEKLFKSEMLARNDPGGRPVYAFRMDLWRLWIRRQHSVWQVVREEGIPRHRSAIERIPLVWRFATGITLAALLVAALVFARIRHDQQASGALSAGMGQIILEPFPTDAMIFMDQRKIGQGTYRDSIPAGRQHLFRLTAQGYADTEVARTVRPGGSDSVRVELRALLGGMRIETVPPGAEIKVDGVSYGRSPLTVLGLRTGSSHWIEASLPEHDPVRENQALVADSVIRVVLSLLPGKSDLRVSTNHDPSQIRVDGVLRGASPLTLSGIRFGRHRISASRDGYADCDTTLDIRTNSGDIHFELRPESPGYLVVKGDPLVDIYVADRPPRKDTQNSGRQQLPPGPCHIVIIFKDGSQIDTTLTIGSAEQVVYDFSKKTVTRQPAGGRP